MAEDELDWLSLPPLALGPSQTLAGGHSLGGDRQVLWCTKPTTDVQGQSALEPIRDLTMSANKFHRCIKSRTHIHYC